MKHILLVLLLTTSLPSFGQEKNAFEVGVRFDGFQSISYHRSNFDRMRIKSNPLVPIGVSAHYRGEQFSLVTTFSWITQSFTTIPSVHCADCSVEIGEMHEFWWEMQGLHFLGGNQALKPFIGPVFGLHHSKFSGISFGGIGGGESPFSSQNWFFHYGAVLGVKYQITKRVGVYAESAYTDQRSWNGHFSALSLQPLRAFGILYRL